MLYSIILQYEQLLLANINSYVIIGLYLCSYNTYKINYEGDETNMKLLFQNKTKYSDTVYNEFLHFHSNHFKYSYLLYTLIVCAVILFLVIAQIKIHQLSISILLCAALTGFILWRIFHPISEVSKEYKSEKIQQQIEYTFKFYENKFTIEDSNYFSNSKYSDIYKVFETDSFFYLYLDKTHSLLLEKNSFTLGSANEFSEFIKRKCLFRYRKK